MSELTGVIIRRVHVLLDKPVKSPLDVKCPDCGRHLFQIVERACGGVKRECKGRMCKDKAGRSKNWIFIIHCDSQSYTDAVKSDSTTIDLQRID